MVSSGSPVARRKRWTVPVPGAPTATSSATSAATAAPNAPCAAGAGGSRVVGAESVGPKTKAAPAPGAPVLSPGAPTSTL